MLWSYMQKILEPTKTSSINFEREDVAPLHSNYFCISIFDWTEMINFSDSFTEIVLES